MHPSLAAAAATNNGLKKKKEDNSKLSVGPIRHDIVFSQLSVHHCYVFHQLFLELINLLSLKIFSLSARISHHCTFSAANLLYKVIITAVQDVLITIFDLNRISERETDERKDRQDNKHQ